MVKTSLCITTYARPEGLRRTLESLAGQSRIPDEVVVSDDGMDEASRRVVADAASCFPALSYFRNDRRLGMPGNLNAAVSRCSGRYIANLHDGDTFAPGMVEEWEAALDAYPTAGFVFSGVGGWPHPTRFGGGVILHDVAPLTSGRDFYAQNLKHRFSSIVWGTVMARRTAYDSLLPFDPDFGFISDVDMWMRMCLSWDVAYVRKPLIVLDHSTTDERGRGVNWSWVETTRRIQVANLKRFYGSDPARLQVEGRRAQRAARRHLARLALGRIRHRDRQGVKEVARLWRSFGLFRSSCFEAERV